MQNTELTLPAYFSSHNGGYIYMMAEGLSPYDRVAIMQVCTYLGFLSIGLTIEGCLPKDAISITPADFNAAWSEASEKLQGIKSSIDLATETAQ